MVWFYEPILHLMLMSVKYWSMDIYGRSGTNRTNFDVKFFDVYTYIFAFYKIFTEHARDYVKFTLRGFILAFGGLKFS